VSLTWRTNSRADAQLLQPLQVVRAVVAQRGHGQRRAAQRLQAVGDVAGAAAKIAPQRGHQERHVQDVQLVGQDLLGKAALEVMMVSKASEPQISGSLDDGRRGGVLAVTGRSGSSRHQIFAALGHPRIS
jgi:hypothetical protein